MHVSFSDPDYSLDDYGPDDEFDDLLGLPAPTETCCGFCGEELTAHERNLDRTVLVRVHAEDVANGWYHAWKYFCARCGDNQRCRGQAPACA